MNESVVITLVVLCSVLVLLFWIIWRRMSRGADRSRDGPIHVLVVLGSGGHTAEMLALVKNLDEKKYCPVSWVVAESDKTSLPRLQREEKAGLLKSQPQAFFRIPRSREVGQSWRSTLLSTLHATYVAVRLVFRVRPELILLNGPGTDVPILIGCLLLRLWTRHPKIIFVESFCRVESLSLTGRICYPFVDRFVVQWPQLTKKYKRAEYIGVLF